MQAKLFPRPPEVFSPPREPSAAADLIAVRYLRPPSATVGRVITGVVAGLFYLLMV